MSIDIKQLRIGSHILVNGVRAKVRRLNTVKYSETETFHILVRGVSPETGREGECGCFADDEAVQPIPITPDLMKELGFVNTSCTRRIVYTKGSEYEDSWIEFKNLKDRWEIFVSKDNWDGRTVVRYLHEAEAFLALHGVELIQD